MTRLDDRQDPCDPQSGTEHGVAGALTRREVRLVAVRVGRAWHRYLTNELDEERLPACYVAALYGERWRSGGPSGRTCHQDWPAAARKSTHA